MRPLSSYRQPVRRAAADCRSSASRADYFRCPREEIEKRIRYYRESGTCTLFR